MGNIQKLGKKCVTSSNARKLYCAAFVAIACLLFSQVNAQTSQGSASQIPISQIQGPRDNTQVYSGVVYGPIDQNDTLWRIASRYKQDARFTVYQTMLAIYELNQQAFENGNFNTMVDGATLQLPSDRYIARIDPLSARAKADQDDRALGRGSSAQNEAVQTDTSGGENSTPVSADNLKPEIPLVNQEDLSKTSAQLQSQLNGLRQQQQQQFQQLKNQVAASISSVEVLLDENKKLNEQLLRIDENNRKVTEEVETELQTQIDQQVEQLSQLIALVKEAEQRRIDKESESILSSPLALVIIMSVVTLLIILVLAIYLLKKPAPIAAPSVIPPSEDIIDDELVIGQVSDELDQDSEDLMVALSNEDALEEDDILSDALEDDDAINAMSDAEMDADLDGLDDMLVPDLPTEVSNIGVSIDSNNAESKSDDGISLEIEDDLLLDEDFASLDLSEPDELGNDNDGIDSETIIDSSSLSESSELEEEQDNSDGSPLGVNLDENGEIDENTIEQIGQKIKAKDETISRMADEILKELDKVPSDSTNIHELVDEENIENEFDADDLSNELLLDLADDEDSSEELDALLESIGDDVESSSSELDESLSVELDEELDKPLDLSAKEDDALSEDLENDQVSQLTDELLKELDNDEPDEVHDLLDELKDTTINANDSNLGNDTSLSKQSEQSLMQKDEIMSPSLDADDLLDDIPSFTSDMSVDDDDLEDLIDEIPETVATDAEIIQEIEESKEIEIPAVDEVDVKSTAQAKDEELEADKIDLDDEDPLDLLDESDEDVLAGLKDLDNWLDEDDQTEPTKEAKDDELDLSALALDDEFDSLGEGGSSLDDGLIQGLDDANFDDMLKDLALDSDINNDLNSKSQSMDDPLASAGLDLDSLMNDDSSLAAFDNEGELVQAKNTESQANDTSEDFVDVDDLLEESDAMAQMIDSDKELDLNGSLDKLTAKQQDEVAMPAVDVESDQASNLDLAQVYMDMEDFEAAKELLDEVVRLGNQEQQEEATGLLVNIKP